MPRVKFIYKNHRGVVAERTVEVDGVDWVPNPGYGYKPGFFLSGLCLDKLERRSFAFDHMLPPEGQDPAKPYHLLVI